MRCNIRTENNNRKANIRQHEDLHKSVNYQKDFDHEKLKEVIK